MFRTVKHVGARTFDATAGITPQALVAMPVFRGDELRWLNYQFFGCEQGDTPPEQPSLINMFIGYCPGIILTGSAQSTAQIEDDMRAALWGDDPGQNPFGGEPNPGAAEGEWNFERSELTGARFLMRKWQLTKQYHFGQELTLVSGSGATTGIQGKHSYGDTGRLRGGRFSQNGVIFAGIWQPDMSAQTTFGITELDDQVSNEELANATENAAPAADGDAAKIQELIFGGDNYIEADTLKDLDHRAYCVIDAGINSPNLRRWRR